MERASQHNYVLDPQFFKATGFVLVWVKLMAGTITVWLAHDIGKTESLTTLNNTADVQPNAPNVELVRHTGETKASLGSNEMVFNIE